MYLLSIFVIFCLSICSHSQDTTEATPLPEDDPQNFQYQNATKLVELNGTHWVKRRTYNVTTSQRAPTCEYAKTTTGQGGKGKNRIQPLVNVRRRKLGGVRARRDNHKKTKTNSLVG
uniref:Putative salivary lipocalin n=1 Tax=Ixodes ricinus TaxID=34613 RepID=A0A0K8RBY6_IXORI